MYNAHSKLAEEFIDDDEIIESITYAESNANNRKLIENLLNKAADGKGLSHREALCHRVMLLC